MNGQLSNRLDANSIDQPDESHIKNNDVSVPNERELEKRIFGGGQT